MQKGNGRLDVERECEIELRKVRLWRKYVKLWDWKERKVRLSRKKHEIGDKRCEQ